MPLEGRCFQAILTLTRFDNRLMKFSVYSGRVPHICGGETTDEALAFGQCYSYSFQFNEWLPAGILEGGNRSDSAYDHSDSWGLVVAGGHQIVEGDGYTTLDTVLSTHDAVFFDFLPNLPNPQESEKGQSGRLQR